MLHKILDIKTYKDSLRAIGANTEAGFNPQAHADPIHVLKLRNSQRDIEQALQLANTLHNKVDTQIKEWEAANEDISKRYRNSPHGLYGNISADIELSSMVNSVANNSILKETLKKNRVSSETDKTAARYDDKLHIDTLKDFMNAPETEAPPEYNSLFSGIRSELLPVITDLNNQNTNLKKQLNKYNLFYPFPESLAELVATDHVLSKQFSTLDSFIQSLPSITIRSYFINSALLEAITLIFGKSIGDRPILDTVVNTWNKLKTTGQQTLKVFKALVSQSGQNVVYAKMINGFNNTKFGISGGKSINLYQIPEILYYRMTTTTSNNKYTIPCEIPSGFFNSSSGGWSSQGGLFGGNSAGSALFSLLKQTNGINVMPTFNVTTGSNDIDRLQISLDLINDNISSAIANTKFIRTLHILNQWVQYGPVQLPGNLYDISIPGTGQRWFMCTADINVTPKGALRYLESISNEKATELGLSNSEAKEFRIPDAYALTIDFTSLIPNNLNNFLLANVANGKDFMGKESFLSKLEANLLDAISGISNVMETINKNTGAMLKTINSQENGIKLSEYAKAEFGDDRIDVADKDNIDVTKMKAYEKAVSDFTQILIDGNICDNASCSIIAKKLANDHVQTLINAVADKRANLKLKSPPQQ